MPIKRAEALAEVKECARAFNTALTKVNSPLQVEVRVIPYGVESPLGDAVEVTIRATHYVP